MKSRIEKLPPCFNFVRANRELSVHLPAAAVRGEGLTGGFRSMVMRSFVIGSMLAVPIFTGHFASKALAADPVTTAPRTQAEMEAAFLATLHRLSDALTKTPDTIVAEIGDRAITRGDIADALGNLPPTNGTRSLDAVYHDAVEGLLVQKALEIRAREAGIDKDPAVQHRVATATDAILANEFLRRAAVPAITDQMVLDLYDQEVSGEPGPEEVQARVIMTNTVEQARKAMAALAAGAEFDDVALHFSKDASASVGGEIGFVRRGAVLPEIGAVMFALAPGQTTAFPIQVAGAWYIIKVEARQEHAPPSLEAVKPQLVQQLTRSGISAVVQQAVNGLTAHDYGMPGKDASAVAVTVPVRQ